MQLLVDRASIRRIFNIHSGATADEDEEDVMYGLVTRRGRRPKRSKHPFPAVPSEEGNRLMRSGSFGSNDHYRGSLKKSNRGLAAQLMYRELGTEFGHATSQNKMIAQVRKSV